MAGKANQRKNQRVQCAVPARVEGPKGPLRGECRNLSLGGMLFVGGTLPVGQGVEVHIDLPQGHIQATGEVRYHAKLADGVGMGIRLTRFPQEHLALVQGFLDAGG